ncbi:MAG: response regulator [Eubacteriales bacterium]|jgi:two-component system KDP operon response regulator KdpE
MITKGTRILVIDDEIEIRRLLKVALSGHGFDVKGAATGRDGLDDIIAFKPELVILDLGLPDLNGLEVLKNLREWSGVPVIILSVKGQENDKIFALDAGADDYVTKPFGMGELLARIRAALRHAAGTEDEPVLVFDDLTIDLARRYVTVNSREIRITPTEYELLKILALNAGKVLTHRHLIRAVWKMTYEYDTHSLRVYIGQLRRKIESDPSYPRHIITEPGVGYRLL